MSADLSYKDTALILEQLGPLAQDVVLIGGQALHFWVEYFSNNDVLLSAAPPFTSKDVDFCGTSKQAEAVASALGGTVRLPTLDDATPQTGVVRFVDSMGEERVIDFLEKPHGITLADVQRMSVPVQTAADGVKFKVLPPVLCMESRVCNISLDGYTTPHAMRQLRASIVCTRESLREIAAGNARAFLKLSERVFRFARYRMQAKDVYDEHAIDPFEAVPADAKLPSHFEKFYGRRYPDMKHLLKADRDRRRNSAALRQSQKVTADKST